MIGRGGGFFTERLFWGYWFPLIIYCLAIFIQSAFPSPKSLPSFPDSDKVMHFTAYAVMGCLFYRALMMTWPGWRPIRIIFFSVLFTTLYGAGDEIHQLFVVSRTADLMDAAADFSGGTFGAVCFYLVMGFFGRRYRRPSD